MVTLAYESLLAFNHLSGPINFVGLTVFGSTGVNCRLNSYFSRLNSENENSAQLLQIAGLTDVTHHTLLFLGENRVELRPLQKALSNRPWV